MRISSSLLLLFLLFLATPGRAGEFVAKEIPPEEAAPQPVAPALPLDLSATAGIPVPTSVDAAALPAAAGILDAGKTYPVVIIGGGPAGLSLAQQLKKRGVEAPILETGDGPGQSWKSMPTLLRVLSEWKLIALPDTPDALVPEEVKASARTLPSAQSFAKYLDDYAAHHGLMLAPRTKVVGLERKDGFLHVATDSHGTIKAKAVVNATGYFSKPFVPHFPGAQTRPQDIHFAQYKDPAQIATLLGGKDKKILIVGKRLSAGQVMRELAGAGFQVSLSARGKVKYSPENSEHLESVVLPIVEPLIIGSGLGHRDPPEVPMEGGETRRLIESGRVPVRGNIARLEGRDVVFEDGRREAFDLIVYATGFRPALEHLAQLPLDENTGRPAVEGMASKDLPGLYFLGLSGEPTFRSRFLRGIRADAAALAKTLVASARTTGRLRALVVSHVLGVFNDTALRTLFSVWVASHLSKDSAATYVSLATALFVLPYILFSTLAGRTADRFAKRKVVQVMKFAEAGILAVAAVAFALGNMHVALGLVFLMGAHAAFLTPAKYAMLAEQVGLDQLAEANSLLEFTSVVSILVGTAAGGLLAASLAHGVGAMVAVFAVTAAVGIAAARLIPAPRLAPAPEAKGKLNLGKGIKGAMAGIGFFWLLGTILQMNVSLFAEHTLRASSGALTALLTTMGAGMGVGAFVSGRLSKGRIELGLVPIGALGAALSVLDLALFGSSSLTRTFVDMIAANFFGGLFLIPLDAYIQRTAPDGMRGRTLGVGNIIAFACILASSGLFYALSSLLHLSPPAVFLAAAFISLGAAAAIFSVLGKNLAAFLRRITGRAAR